jgi:hypothetical protein
MQEPDGQDGDDKIAFAANKFSISCGKYWLM